MFSLILAITLVLLALPIIFIVAALSGACFHLVPGLCVLALHARIWPRFRLGRFVVHGQMETTVSGAISGLSEETTGTFYIHMGNHAIFMR